MAHMIYLRDVVTLDTEQEKCVGCGMCLLVCPHAVFAIDNGMAVIQNRDACIECGACSVNCPTEAISVRAGVGCATAVINSALGRKSDSCCCVVDSPEKPRELGIDSPGPGANKTTCC